MRHCGTIETWNSKDRDIGPGVAARQFRWKHNALRRDDPYVLIVPDGVTGRDDHSRRPMHAARVKSAVRTHCDDGSSCLLDDGNQLI
jgi:hypothetical protein